MLALLLFSSTSSPFPPWSDRPAGPDLDTVRRLGSTLHPAMGPVGLRLPPGFIRSRQMSAGVLSASHCRLALVGAGSEGASWTPWRHQYRPWEATWTLRSARAQDTRRQGRGGRPAWSSCLTDPCGCVGGPELTSAVSRRDRGHARAVSADPGGRSGLDPTALLIPGGGCGRRIPSLASGGAPPYP